jgi:uncharacterized repeat protein (TIGR01451 family)
MKSNKLKRFVFILMAVSLFLPQSLGVAGIQAAPANATPPHSSTPASETPPGISKNNGRTDGAGDLADEVAARMQWFYSLRAASSPQSSFSIADAAVLRAKAADEVIQQGQTNVPSNVAGYGGAWSPLGPNPIIQEGRTTDNPLLAMAGRIGALAIRSTPPYTMYLGGAQGGIWISSTLTTQWTPMTDNLPSLAIGAIALAPSNEDIVYVGTGEGALSGDSYFGNGVLKSTDAGHHFAQVSGNTFTQVSISKIVVDPTNPSHLYVAALSGVAGSVNVRPPGPSLFGVWQSIDGGVTWTPSMVTNDRLKGATDLVMDPRNPSTLYASFESLGIYKTIDGGASWHAAMNGFPTGANYAAAPTRFALGISHEISETNATLYAGFEYVDASNHLVPSTVWKSTDNAASWTQTNTAVVNGYCTGTSSQCFYDNVIGVDPTNADIVYVLGLFNYSTGTGGIYRSMDGGATWVDLGWHQHPDFHAIAIRKDAPNNLIIGNDGGVWKSSNYGGRTNPSDPIDAADWVDLNGTVDPSNGTVIARSNLQIAQFTSMQQNPSITGRVYGGTQDNGTLRKSSASASWVDMSSGDGGQTLVDPYNPAFVYGEYFLISPYRFTDGMLGPILNNTAIYTGLNRNDRSAFYVPFSMDPEFSNRLYLGSYRVYRTDNQGDLWQIISNDLTSGCTDRNLSPTGVNCVITAMGPSAGSPALYVGTGDGLVWLTKDATVASPTWTQLNAAPLPVRPVSSFAVDRSNYRIAYVAYSGFNAATIGFPGHVFKTSDAGASWTDISGNLPDIPVNNIGIDPNDPNTLYAATDVGPMVTRNGGTSWSLLGSGFPVVATSQLNINAFTGLMRVSSYGRGAWSLSNLTAAPALQIRAFTPSVPLGANSVFSYTLTVKNWGNLAASGVTISDTLPDHTSFMSADSGGTLNGNVVTWTGLATAMPTVTDPTFGGITPGSVSVHLTVKIAADRQPGDIITDQTFGFSSAQGERGSGSPTPVTLAPANALTLSPASQVDGTKPGQVVTYTLTAQNMGSTVDNYNLSSSGNKFPTTFWNAAFTTQINQTGNVNPGDTIDFGVKVGVPITATGGLTDTATIKATSSGNPAVSATASIQTIAVTNLALLVDEDGNNPDVDADFIAALKANHISFDKWDLLANATLPVDYLLAHKMVFWYTGTSYPGPILPYESELTTFLNGGGRLFLTGMDILDQSAGTTAFVHDFLHVNWDGTEVQNDVGTTSVTAVITNPVTTGLGTFALDYARIGYDDFSDEITPTSPAIPAFNDTHGKPDALTVTEGSYKVVFLAYPFEAIASASNKADFMARVLKYFGVNYNYLPEIRK